MWYDVKGLDANSEKRKESFQLTVQVQYAEMFKCYLLGHMLEEVVS